MTMATLCPSPDVLRALSLGNLSQTESDDLFDHVKSCDECQAELDTIHSNSDSLIEQLRSPDELRTYQIEPNCQSAVARALGALAQVDRALDNADHSHLPPRLGEYVIERRLGSGGMGSVYLGRHTKLGREVAIKILAQHRWHDPRFAERFEAEIKAIGRLAHPNIVSAYDAREVDGMAVLITEYVDGYDLGALLKRTGPMSIADACEIVRQTAMALDYTHSQGFVHRDVKPSNIMLSRLGHVKLLDLGLARLQFQNDQQPGLTGTGQALGTADYIAPEQVIDGRSVDTRADIYSLGCTLFKLLTGFAPFETKQHSTAFAKMTAHVSTPAPNIGSILPSLPAKLQQLIGSMMAKSPEKRPQRLVDVMDELASFTSSANLSELVRCAATQEGIADEPIDDARPSNVAAHPQTSTARRFPWRVLIATGFISAFLGFLLGVIITIKYADGTIVKHQVPDGSDVTIAQEKSDVASEGQAAGMPNAASVDTASSGASARHRLRIVDEISTDPLCFGIVAELDKTGVWFDVAKHLELSVMTREENGRRQIQIESDEKQVILWRDIFRHLSAMSTSKGVTLGFNGPLAERMSALTQANLGRHLAILVNGKIVAAPKIVAPVRSSAELMGLERTESELLMQALRGLTNHSPREEEAPSGLAASPASEVQAATLNRLRELAKALNNYEAAYQRFPASANTMLDGQPVPHPYSWRVAILPFLGPEEAKLFREYDFQQPWDSETNRRLLDKMPAVFNSPLVMPKPEKPGVTHYYGFVGEQGAFGKSEGKQIREFTDGTSRSILIFEGHGGDIFWTQPFDVPVENPGRFVGKLNCALADGSVRTFDAEQLKTIERWITIAGNERIDP